MAILKDTQARNIKPEDKPKAHGGITGLSLHPSKTKGNGKWVLRYVSPVTSKRRNAGLGAYPSVSIAEAAREAAKMREQIEAGIDPLEEKAQKQKIQSIPTFEDAAKTLHKELLPSWKNAKHGQQWINTLTQYVFPFIGSTPLDKIEPRHIAEALRPIWLDKAETANRTKQRIHAVMAWGWAHGYCTSNPVDVVEHLLPKQESKATRTEHHPAMPWQKIPKFVKEHVALNNKSDVTRSLLEFVILTACRSGEARGARWSEIDWKTKTWIIPSDRMKAKTSHRVPLSDRALEILNLQLGLHKELIFPSRRARKELSDMVLTSFLRRVNAPSNTIDRIATAHGFRSSFRDWCSENGYPRDLAERSLAHAIQNQVEAAYHRTDLLEQRRPLMQAWSDFVTSKNITNQEKTLN